MLFVGFLLLLFVLVWVVFFCYFELDKIFAIFFPTMLNSTTYLLMLSES